MKLIQALLLAFACYGALAQKMLLTNNFQSTQVFIKPINEQLYPTRLNNIQSYIAAEVNKKLFAHPLFRHHQKEKTASTQATINILKQTRFSFRQSDITRHFQTGGNNTNNTLSTIASITGSVLDTFLQQYTIQK